MINDKSMIGIDQAWREYWVLYMEVYDNKVDSSKVSSWNTRVGDWLLAFANCFAHESVTPYMHVFAHHLGYFAGALHSRGGVKVFSNQAVEKLNSLITLLYFRGSSRKADYLAQMMGKSLRRTYAHMKCYTPLQQERARAVCKRLSTRSHSARH